MDRLESFCRLVRTIDARGILYVVYNREAYTLADSTGVRISFDRNMVGSIYLPGEIRIPDNASATPPKLHRNRISQDGFCVMKLKYWDARPDQINELPNKFGLQRIAAPKYQMCVDALGLYRPPSA